MLSVMSSVQVLMMVTTQNQSLGNLPQARRWGDPVSEHPSGAPSPRNAGSPSGAQVSLHDQSLALVVRFDSGCSPSGPRWWRIGAQGVRSGLADRKSVV